MHWMAQLCSYHLQQTAASAVGAVGKLAPCKLCQWLGSCSSLVKTLDVVEELPFENGVFMEILLGKCRVTSVSAWSSVDCSTG